MRQFRILIILASAYIAAQYVYASPCNKQTFGDNTTLQGIVVVRTYAGPPNYRNTNRGDTPERTRVLNLSETLCVSAHPSNSDNPANLRTKAVQLVFVDSNERIADMPLTNFKAAVTGKLFSAQSGHHHTRVLLEVNELIIKVPSAEEK